MPKLPDYLTDHPSLVGIIRFPTVNYGEETVDIPVVRHDSEGNYDTVIQPVAMATNITSIDVSSGAYSIQKESICDMYPYTYYVLTDFESEPLVMLPQYMGSSVSVIGKFALSHTPIERYYPNYYKGSTNGTVYNITNHSQMMLPVATNEGMSYLTANASTIAQTKKSQVVGNVLNAVNTGMSIMTATTPTEKAQSGITGVSNFISGLEQIKQMDARNKDLLLTPNTISSYGTPSTRNKFNSNKVSILKYTIKDVAKHRINNFVARYGNKYNNYATINLRTYKGYIKMIEPDIDSKIDNKYISKIKEILERGVFVE